jgi:putative selenium metabolism hydrolase
MWRYSNLSSLLKRISGLVDEHKEEAIFFLQEVIRTPSPSGQEAEVARIIADKMRTIGYTKVKIDGLNDVMGTMKGFGNGRSLLFNCHIDHVPAGNMVDPYSSILMDGQALGVVGDVVYGRAASDMKGAVAAMVMAGAILSELNIKLEGDYKIAAVALEETGGDGTKSTIQKENFLGDLVIIGEATNMNVYLGHRGGARTEVIVKGRSCHASAPDRGVNAIYMAADLINRIRSDLVPKLPDHPIFGRTTLTVTKMDVKPNP